MLSWPRINSGLGYLKRCEWNHRNSLEYYFGQQEQSVEQSQTTLQN